MASEYTFKFLNGDEYSDQTDNLVSLNLDVKQVAENWTFLKISDIEKAYLSQSTLHYFETLLAHYKLCHLKDLLINIAVNLQFAFITNEGIYRDDILDDFANEDVEYARLLSIIEEYLFNTGNKLQSISINFSKKTAAKGQFKSRSLINDIMVSLTKSLNITPDNFNQRKEEIIKDMNIIKQGRGGEYIRTYFVQQQFSFLKGLISNKSENHLLRFIGCFLHICEIPYHSTVSEIQINSIEEELESIEIPKMRHYLNRSKKIFTNN